MKISIIGAGAAGCFCAVNLKRMMPEADICVYERGPKALAKVAITGGGRCNLTNSFRDVKSAKQVYPRGDKLMKRALKVFSHEDTMRWFEREGVRLVVQADQCVFPKSQDAMEIVGTLTRLMRELGIVLRLNSPVGDIRALMAESDCVVVATGGSPRQSGLFFLDSLRLKTVSPVPSLFSFNIGDPDLRDLMGIVVENVACKLTSTKLQSAGPLLITHWGISGPAVLKLSSQGARWLAEHGYKADVCIDWLGEANAQSTMERLCQYKKDCPQRQLSNVHPQELNQRLWNYLVQKAGLSPLKKWCEVGGKQMNRLVETLTADVLHISGRGTYKDEFVTCGGVSLENIDINTMQCKQYPGLYFAGEVLDVDAVTGGFNLQAAWSMGYIIARHIGNGME